MPKSELARILPCMQVGLMILKNAPALYYGTSPNKFFDYIASGLPVLNNYPGWLADMIADHHCGAVVPPGDPVAFADAVVSLRDRRGELRAMGARARRLAEERFARPRLADQLVRLLEEVHASR
jgi:glycosyltransferase involved in cell wall biosynthesis